MPGGMDWGFIANFGSRIFLVANSHNPYWTWGASRMQRTNQILMAITIVAISWFGMQAVHEAGHVLGAGYHPRNLDQRNPFP